MPHERHITSIGWTLHQRSEPVWDRRMASQMGYEPLRALDDSSLRRANKAMQVCVARSQLYYQVFLCVFSTIHVTVAGRRPAHTQVPPSIVGSTMVCVSNRDWLLESSRTGSIHGNAVLPRKTKVIGWRWWKRWKRKETDCFQIQTEVQIFIQPKWQKYTIFTSNWTIVLVNLLPLKLKCTFSNRNELLTDQTADSPRSMENEAVLWNKILKNKIKIRYCSNLLFAPWINK